MSRLARRAAAADARRGVSAPTPPPAAPAPVYTPEERAAGEALVTGCGWDQAPDPLDPRFCLISMRVPSMNSVPMVVSGKEALSAMVAFAHSVIPK